MKFSGGYPVIVVVVAVVGKAKKTAEALKLLWSI